MSYTSRAQLSMNEILASVRPIYFDYLTWAAGVEKTIFSKRIDITGYNSVILTRAVCSGGTVAVRLYFDGVLVAGIAEGGGLALEIDDISAYAGSKVVEIRLYSAATNGSVRNYVSDGQYNIKAVSMQFISN